MQPRSILGFCGIHLNTVKTHGDSCLKDMICIGGLDHALVFLYCRFYIFHAPAVEQKSFFGGGKLSVRCVGGLGTAVLQFNDQNIPDTPDG